MTSLVCNRSLTELIKALQIENAGPKTLRLPDAIVEAEFVKLHNCYFIKSQIEANLHIQPQTMHDEIGYECFINHIHLDGGSFGERVVLTLRIFAAIENKWALSEFRNLPIRQIVSFDNESVVYRFHVIRPNQEWLAPNLDAFEDFVMTNESSKVD